MDRTLRRRKSTVAARHRTLETFTDAGPGRLQNVVETFSKKTSE